MPRANEPLPDFLNPPIVEVAAAIQFETVERPPTWIAGWLPIISSRFPHLEEKPPLEQMIEDLGSGKPRSSIAIRMMTEPPKPRYWFMNRPNGDELIQIQEDRFIYNWRGYEAIQYPRYKFVRKNAADLYEKYFNFILGITKQALRPTVLELTYVNHLRQGRDWKNLSDLSDLLTFIGRNELKYLPDNLSATLSYLIPTDNGAPQARLRCALNQQYFISNQEPVIHFELSVRGIASKPSKKGIFDFFDMAHREIVLAFSSLTTKKAHELWGRKYA